MSVKVNHFIVILALVFIATGATVLIDIWSYCLKKFFKIASLDYALVGRWMLIFIHSGQLKHQHIAQAPAQKFEKPCGWAIHYFIGFAFTCGFIAITGISWLQQPQLLSAMLFGLSTVLFPFLIMQPCFGLGLFAGKVPRPWQARLKSVITHLLFGISLFLGAKISAWFLDVYLY